MPLDIRELEVDKFKAPDTGRVECLENYAIPKPVPGPSFRNVEYRFDLIRAQDGGQTVQGFW